MNSEITHHLTPDLLMAYSAGTLPEAFNLMVAAHLSLCPACRAEAESYDMIGGDVLETEASPVEEDAFAQTMALIAGGLPHSPKPPPRADSILPGPLQNYAGPNLDAIKWTPLGMGARQSILSTSRTATARLLYIPAGAAMPDHGHRGLEMTMVLKGAYQDDHGYFARGDVEIADSNIHHTPVADIHEDCICLAVTDAPLTFKGLIPRIAQPFLRI